MRCTLVLLLLSQFLCSTGQNLVPNPSFEHISGQPNNWMGTGIRFDAVIDSWKTANGGSPDIFHEEKIGKFLFKRRNVFMKGHLPRTGKVMVGIKTYGCNVGTMHCKEYLQIKLKKPLELYKEYYVEFWVNPISTSIDVNNFGAFFNDEIITGGDGEEALMFSPEILDTTIVSAQQNEWVRISGRFTAGCECEYLVIGNFFMDDDTEVRRSEKDLKYSYYLIEDVLVKSLSGETTTDNWEDHAEVGNTITLQKIFFAHDKAQLLSKSFQELNQLVSFLNKNPNMRIKILGHTDDQGDDAYNLELSLRRAESVLKYLVSKKIQQNRLEITGHGALLPIGDNTTETGRQLNRRVEFQILSL